MTKEELAKKKGIKAKETTQTAAEALITTKTEDTKVEITEAVEQSKTKATAPKKTTKKKDTPKAGRPKGKPSTKISLNVPNEYLEIVNIAAGINYKGNTSSYIVSLIEKDIKANGKIYEQIKAIANS